MKIFGKFLVKFVLMISLKSSWERSMIVPLVHVLDSSSASASMAAVFFSLTFLVVVDLPVRFSSWRLFFFNKMHQEGGEQASPALV